MSYTTPENSLKRAEEYNQEGNWEAALDTLHEALQNRRNRSNNQALEKIMLVMIDICTEQKNPLYLKEDIGHFRNLVQHTNMASLETVLKTLRNKADSVINDVEAKEGQEKLQKILSDESEENVGFQEGEMNPEELILLANCDITGMEYKHSITPAINFFLDVSKIILDSLRQNSKMLEFYNSTALRTFEFCSKYNCKREYMRVSETIHSHFNQILKQAKYPELLQQSKIPFPVRLDEEESLQKVLELRYDQLKISLKMKIWSDAFRTSENIYQLINRQKHHASKMKQILSDFFYHLSNIFWESEFYLFHSYSLLNLSQIIRSNKSMNDEQKASITIQFVLSALSIPLNNSLSNFERLSVHYVPQGMSEFMEESQKMKPELLAIANMLQIKGYPSRQSLINYIKMKNIQALSGLPQIAELFRLVQEEESPFTISNRGKVIIDEIIKAYPPLAKYKDFLTKTLSVRILQKCRNYFKNLKLESLKKMLQFYDNFQQIEVLLYECNREGLVKTVIDHLNQSLTFDQEEEVSQNLQKFGLKLKEAFQKVQDTQHVGGERQRIFLKVKEKLEDEVNEMGRRKEEMVKMKDDIAKTKAEESKTLQEILSQQQTQKEVKFEKQKVKEEKERQKNKLLDELELMRKIRAQEVVQELIKKGVKKIGSAKITDIEKRGDLDYDTVMQFYQNLLKKEKEQAEAEKKKKIKEVEQWARAVREEEKIAIVKYCEEHGEEEMKQIQKAIKDRHDKELKMKLSLENAFPLYKQFKDSIMTQRKQEHERKIVDFINKVGSELQQKIIEDAKSEHKKDENKKKVKEADEMRKKILQQKMANRKPEEFENDDDSNEGWSRNVKRAEPQKDERAQRSDKKEQDGFISRGTMGQKPVEQVEIKREEAKGPPKRFTNTGKGKETESNEGLTRSTMFGTAKKEEEKTAPTTQPGGRPTFTRGPPKESAGTANDWKKGVEKPKESDKDAPKKTTTTAPTTSASKPKPSAGKADDGWNFSSGRTSKK